MKSTKFYKGFSINKDRDRTKGKIRSSADRHQKDTDIHEQTFHKFRSYGDSILRSPCIQKSSPCVIKKISKKRDHIYGDPEAELSIIEYLDFECLFCKEYNLIPKKLVHRFGGKLNWVSRHFPALYRNPGALIKAEASECANELGGLTAFWKYSEQIFSYNKTNKKVIPRNELVPLAYKIGLDGQKFKLFLDNGTFQFRILEDLTEGAKIGIFRTPSSFILNNITGEFILKIGPASLDELMDDIRILKTESRSSE